MDFLIRFAQVHESFRKPEIQALATLRGVNVEFLVYTDDVGSIRHDYSFSIQFYRSLN